MKEFSAEARRFFSLIRMNDVEVAETLLRANPGIAAEDDGFVTPLFWAIENGSCDGILLLLRSGVDVNAPNQLGMTPLMYAAETAEASILQFLLQHGAKAVASESGSALHTVAATVHCSEPRKMIEILIGAGLGVNCVDMAGATPLHVAAESNNTDAIKELLIRGANLMAKDSLGQTPLHVAVERNRTDAIRELLNRGASPTAKDSCQQTPLHLIQPNTPIEVLDLLVEHGAKINDPDENGNTPIDMARYVHNWDAVQVLTQFKRAGHG